MLVILNPINSLFNSFEPSLNRLTALFKSLLETLTSCWGNRKAAPIETPTETAEKVDKTFKKAVLDQKQTETPIETAKKVDITSKEAVLEKNRFMNRASQKLCGTLLRALSKTILPLSKPSKNL